VIFAEAISLYPTRGEVPEDDYAVPFGQAEIKRAGSDVTVVAIGAMVPKALKAAEELADQGLEIEVIDPKTLVPLDIDTIVESVKKTGRLVVTHLAHKVGGVGAEIAQQVTELAFNYLDAPVKRVAAAQVPAAASQNLEAALYPGTPEIVAACLAFKR